MPVGRRAAAAGPYGAAVLAAIVLVATTLWGHDGDGFGNGRQLRIMVPAAPGGGWDQTAREMQAALRGEVGRTEVANVAGGGGTIGLSQFVRHEGDPTRLMVTGLVMVGAVESNDSPVGVDRTTPLARLVTDHQVIVVPVSSPVRTVADLVARMRQDPGSVSFAGGPAGGIGQILAGMIADTIGVDPARVSYLAHPGAGEALSTVLSGRATVGVAGVSEMQGQIRAGTVRAVAVSSPRRLPTLPDVPTLGERGVDVELANWRGVVAPPGIGPDDERRLEDLLVRMTRTAAWRETLRRRGWTEATLTGDQFRQYIERERRTVTRVLVLMGLA
ncbi:tripartite tricarboxylate transporter substrate binding protein [Actinoplanes sp. LDG1-06]|uniref:Tripartite tricarboxylate transporter substrate binding protein n=1 Tax=Paractinoplanes ovalisporus TaxID=2810368 RepID=A0ABS2A476_9ACTN|nr:tripartite tricarboxylate transporter substrate binding protein [Actinoplanes ovalisporus]MBM2614655.1 tripartite tricarboxylate transporter substrate binding protein [Actinoplanes ovalisporus]